MVITYLNKYYMLALLMFLFWNYDRSEKMEPVKSYFLGQETPGLSPVRFAADIITDNFYPHSKLIIAPDNDRIYWSSFLDLESYEFALYYSEFNGEDLSIPKPDTVLIKYGITSFIYSNNGNTILFGSERPYDELDGKTVGAIWTCEKTGLSWELPQPIEATMDTNWASIGSASINDSGDIYFVGRMEGDSPKIYMSEFVNGSYQKFEALPEIINNGIAIDPFIDYQDRYLLFAGDSWDDSIGFIDLYISYKDENGNWQEPSNLGQGINTPYLDRFPMVTRDGRYLFFVTSNSNHFPSAKTHYYWVDAQILNK